MMRGISGAETIFSLRARAPDLPIVVISGALMKSGAGDRVTLHAPGGSEQLEILEVRYQPIPVEPFSEPPGAESAPRGRPSSEAS